MKGRRRTLNKINKLKEKVFGKKKGTSDATGLVDLIRELGCLPDVLGREYEVYDAKGKLVYRIEQKSLSIGQIKVLQEEIDRLRKIEAEQANKASRRRK